MRCLALAALAALAAAQQVGTSQAEVHPPLTTYECSASGCAPDSTTSLVLDANWRWTHKVGSSTNCYTGDEWDAGICPDPVTCAANCALDGADCAFNVHNDAPARCARSCDPSNTNNQPYARLATLNQQTRAFTACASRATRRPSSSSPRGRTT